MDIQQIITQLQNKFGGSLDSSKITGALKGMDLSNSLTLFLS